jgi:hypothetical protein
MSHVMSNGKGVSLTALACHFGGEAHFVSVPKASLASNKDSVLDSRAVHMPPLDSPGESQPGDVARPGWALLLIRCDAISV